MSAPARLTGLFLGAGASYEAGMPLVWELTNELKRWLTPEKLRALNESWRAQGGGYPDEVINDFAALLGRPDMHYESVLGYLETQFRRPTADTSQDYHGLYSWLVEMVYNILYLRHVNSGVAIQRSLTFFEGLTALVADNTPLWVFSLNHDMIIECICAKLRIPLSGGFSDDVISLPRRDKRGVVIGQLKAAVLAGDALENSGMPFFRHGTHGVNLLKIHGALDIFTFRDGKDLLRILPLDSTVDGVLGALRSANTELLYLHPSAPSTPFKATNEIAYADEDGEMQFLRRTLLAGAYKFDARHSQVLPFRFLDHFRASINRVTTLISIGYGFGDSHINQVMRDWLEFSGERRLIIVGPSASSVPSTFLHVAPQVDLEASTASDYLDSRAAIGRSRWDVAEKKLVAWLRQKGYAGIARRVASKIARIRVPGDK